MVPSEGIEPSPAGFEDQYANPLHLKGKNINGATEGNRTLISWIDNPEPYQWTTAALLKSLGRIRTY